MLLLKYINISTQQEIFELLKSSSKTSPVFDGQLFSDYETGKRKCELSGEECANYTIHGENVILVRPCLTKHKLWQLINDNVLINNIPCEAYQNIISKQVLYYPKTKAVDYIHKLYYCGQNRYDCANKGDQCANLYDDNNNIIYIAVNPTFKPE